MQIQKVIEQLGYSSKEAKVYLAALELGECRISDIAERVKLPRTSAQIIIDKLHEDGLVNFYVMRRYKYWVAENPTHLLARLHRREELVKEALPRLDALRKASMRKNRTEDAKRFKGVFSVLADAAAQPILIANEQAEIEYVNAAWQRQFDYSLEEVRGKNPRMLQSGQTPRNVYDRMWAALRAERMFQSDEIVDKRKDGTLFNLLTTIFPLRHGQQLFYVQILDDITERKRVETLHEHFLKTARGA